MKLGPKTKPLSPLSNAVGVAAERAQICKFTWTGVMPLNKYFTFDLNTIFLFKFVFLQCEDFSQLWQMSTMRAN